MCSLWNEEKYGPQTGRNYLIECSKKGDVVKRKRKTIIEKKGKEEEEVIDYEVMILFSSDKAVIL